jgi:hypothetical protein
LRRRANLPAKAEFTLAIEADNGLQILTVVGRRAWRRAQF